MRHLWLLILALLDGCGVCIEHLSILASRLLIIGGFLATVLHILHMSGVPVPDPLPFLPSSLPN